MPRPTHPAGRVWPSDDHRFRAPLCSARRWRAQRVPPSAYRGSSEPSTQFIKHVGRCDDADELISVHHGQTADQAPAHEVGGLAESHLWIGVYQARAHQIPNRSPLTIGVAGPAAQIPLADKSDESPVVRNDEVANPLLTHARPSHGSGLCGVDRYDIRAHDVLQSHSLSLCEHEHVRCGWDAGVSGARLGRPCHYKYSESERRSPARKVPLLACITRYDSGIRQHAVAACASDLFAPGRDALRTTPGSAQRDRPDLPNGAMELVERARATDLLVVGPTARSMPRWEQVQSSRRREAGADDRPLDARG